MDNSENQFKDDFRFGKDEIIRGYNSYLRILQNSATISTDYLKAFVNKDSNKLEPSDFTKSPHFTNSVKVGFIVAKKKIRKSYFRNRIRRLLKESYRLNRNRSLLLQFDLKIIFTLSDKGYDFFAGKPQTKQSFTDSEMKILLNKIHNKFRIK